MKTKTLGRKLLSALLVAAMLVSVVPAAFAAGTENGPQEIEIVGIETGIPVQTAAGAVAENFATPEDYGEIRGVWYQNGAALAENTVLEAGKDYEIRITATVKDGYSFAPEAFVKVNGVEQPVTRGENTLTVHYPVTIPAAVDSVITSAKWDLEEEYFHCTTSSMLVSDSDDVPYTLSYCWFDGETKLYPDVPFEANKSYTMEISFKAKNGHTFSDTAKYAINGEEKTGVLNAEKTKAVIRMDMIPNSSTVDPALITAANLKVPDSILISKTVKNLDIDEADHPYTVRIEWLNSKGAMFGGEFFNQNEQYTLKVTITAREGRTFIDGLQASINGAVIPSELNADKTVLTATKQTVPYPSGKVPAPNVDSVITAAKWDLKEEDLHREASRSTYYFPPKMNYTASYDWYDGETCLEPGTPFETGKSYTMKLSFAAKEGYTFSDTATFTINGEAKTGVLNEEKTIFTIRMDMVPNNSAPSIPPIITVAVTLPDEVIKAAEAKNYASAEANAPYTVSAVWMDGENPVAEGTAFEAGKTYTLKITFTAAEGQNYGAEVKATVNGEEKSGVLNAEDKTCTVELALIPVEAASTYVAKIVRNGADVNYETLDAAIEDAMDGETIIVLTDCSTAWTQGFYFGKSLIFQLDGHTVTFPCGFCVGANKGITFDGGTVSMQGITVGHNGDSGNFKSGIVINNGGRLNVMNTTMNLNCTTGDGIYGHPNVEINIVGSVLNITGCAGNGITKDNGTAGINVMVGSTLNVTGCRAGITNTWDIRLDASTLNISNNKGNASNGSNYYINNKSKAMIANNGGHGMSASKVEISGSSSVVANGNAYYGITINGGMEMDGTSTLTTDGNGSGFTGGGVRFIGANSALIKSGAVVTITNNQRNGLLNYIPTTFEDGVALTIIANHSKDTGGGIYNEANLTLPAGAAIYNNHAVDGGDDIYGTSGSQIVLGAVGTGWKLDGVDGNCLRSIDNWYDDSEDARWNAHSQEGFHVEAAAGKLEGPIALKAAHGIASAEKTVPAELRFQKVDSVTGDPIKGAEFTLYADSTCTRSAGSFTTDISGQFIAQLTAGEYYLKETKAPAGYRLDSTVYPITVTEKEPETELVWDTTVTPNEATNTTVITCTSSVASLLPDPTGLYRLENEAVREIVLKKLWQDGDDRRLRSDSVELSFLANGKEIEKYTLSADNNWQTRVVVPKYDENGKEIKYSVKELTKVKGYTTEYRDGGFTVVNVLEGKTPGPAGPKTGDESFLFFWMTAMVLSAACAAGLIYEKARKR